MNKSKIEWCDYTVNPVKGLCPVGCSYCYARRLYKRFGWNPEIRCDDDWMMPLYKLKQPSRVFVGSTMELFGDWMKSWWLEHILLWTAEFPHHTFIFLTKKPENLPRSWPDNCWVGITATNEAEFGNATNVFFRHRVAKTQFISIEPLLSWDTSHWFHPLPSHVSREDIDLIIIGQQTPVRKATMPKIEWIREIVDAADKAGVPAFLKNNLFDLVDRDGPETDFAFDTAGQLRQEFPVVQNTADRSVCPGMCSVE